VVEAHPEISFYELNECVAIEERKKKSSGFRARRELLEEAGFGSVIAEMLTTYPRKDVARDDVLDACVCCWTAERILRRAAIQIPGKPVLDSRGLRMEIWR
jgi:predicted RNase H-like nuclease